MLAIGILDMNHLISIVNLRTIFGHTANEDFFLDRYLPKFSDIGRTRTDFFLKLTPLIVTRNQSFRKFVRLRSFPITAYLFGSASVSD